MAGLLFERWQRTPFHIILLVVKRLQCSGGLASWWFSWWFSWCSKNAQTVQGIITFFMDCSRIFRTITCIPCHLHFLPPLESRACSIGKFWEFPELFFQSLWYIPQILNIFKTVRAFLKSMVPHNG